VVLPRILTVQLESTGEYDVKAAFLHNFAKFIDWPPNAFASPQSPFLICVLGIDPFGHSMDDTLRGRMVGTHAVTIRRIRGSADLRHCQMAFVSSSESPRLPEVLESL
jgi:hypothetical protein